MTRPYEECAVFSHHQMRVGHNYLHLWKIMQSYDHEINSLTIGIFTFEKIMKSDDQLKTIGIFTCEKS